MYQRGLVRKWILLAGLILSFSAYAQHIPMVYDANDREIGSLELYTTLGGNQATIATEDGLWIDIFLDTGEVRDHRSTYYENRDCTGEVSMSGNQWNIVDQIIRTYRDRSASELFLLSKDAEYKAVNVQSSMHNGGCGINELGLRMHTVLERIDPEDYGFILQPDGEWIFPTPLKVINKKIIQSEIIYCNSFENCPIQ
jgi:hypothetical protein